MSPKGRFHEATRETVEEWLSQSWAQAFRIIREHTLTLDDGTILEPDFLVYDRGAQIKDRPLTGADIRLVIEVADSSWLYDTEDKAPKYAAFSVLEYWVIRAKSGVVRVHRDAGASVWAETRDVPAGEPPAPLCAPHSPLRLTSL
jgi:Uma2 family endonuclease